MTMKPQRTFTGVEGNNSTGMQGPDALKKDIDTLGKMLDPDAIHDDGSQGGIGEGNLNFNLRGDLANNGSVSGASGAEQVGSKSITGLKDPDNASLQALTVWDQIKAATMLILASPSKTESLTGKTLVEPIISGGLYLNAEKDAGLVESATAEVVLYGTNGNREVALTMKPFYTGEDYANVLMVEGRDVPPAKVWNELNDGPTSGMSAQFAAEATKLSSIRKINGFSFNGTSDVVMIGECNTVPTVADKIVTFSSTFTASSNVMFGVRFLYGSTATSALTLTINGTKKAICIGSSYLIPLVLKAGQVYIFAFDNYTNSFNLLGYEAQGDLVLLRDVGDYFTANNAEGALQEVGSHLVALDGSVAARYTKTEMQTSGSALLHWDNLTNKPNLADNHWKTPVVNQAALPLTGNGLDDCRVVLDDGDGKQAVYLCIATTGTLTQQWAKVADVDWMSEEQTRITQENARVTAEGGRVTAETNRSRDEDTREAAELVRKTSETSRISGESSRQTGEQTRFNNEETRKSNETARQNAEVVRSFLHPYDNASTYAGGMKVTYEGSTYQALKASLGNLPTNTEFWICIAQKGDNTTAVAVSYSNTVSGLVANTAQGAIDESAVKITSVETDLTGEIGTTNSNLSQLSDSVTAITNGALFKTVYDKDNSGSVDKADLASNAEMLGGNLPAHYQSLMINDVIEGGQKTVQALIDRILENICKAYAWTVLETKYDSWASFEALGLSWNDINEGGY